MQQSCERRDQGGGGRCHRAEAVAHFSFVVGSCSFRFFIERKRERVRERESEADTLGKFTLELAGFSAAGGGRAGSEP